MTNSLVVGRVDVSTPLAGTFLIEDCESIASGIRNGDWLEGGMGAFAAVADGIATVVDPLGSLIAAGIGWILEHLEPIKGWFNDLTGDAGEVMGFAGTWENIAHQMQAASEELTRILGDLDDQHGVFVDTYRRFQADAAKHAAAAGALASAVGTGMQVASSIVQIVHDMTRDALSELVGTAISAVATAAITVGFGTPWAVAQVTSRVAELAGRVGKYVTKLIDAIKRLMPMLDDASRLLRSLRGAFDDALAGASGALHSLTRKADDAAEAVPRHPLALQTFDSPQSAVAALREAGMYSEPGSSLTRFETGDYGVSMMGADNYSRFYANADSATLGAPGREVWMTSAQDLLKVNSLDDAALATGHADSVVRAARDGEPVYALVTPLKGLDPKVPDAEAAGMNMHFLPGGWTASTAESGAVTVLDIQEFIVSGGKPVPPGTMVMKLGADGWKYEGIFEHVVG